MVKKGYKQTEIGVIPEDWEVKPLKVVAPLQRGFDLPYSSIKDGKYPVVFSNGIGAYHSSYMVKGPGVVMGRSGTIGKIHYVKSDYWPHNTTLWVTDFHNNDPLFASYLFKTIPWNLYNSGSGVPTLNRNDVQDYLVAIPSPKEQTEIAAILSDVDTLINSLKRQIIKKKAIKQGAMQELLTGKRRLPGFFGEWQSYVFGYLFDFIPNNAFTRAQMDVSGRVKNIHYGDILTKYGAYISADSKDIPYIAKEIDLSRFSEKCYLQSGDLVIADTAEDETVGKALEVINVECPVLAGQHTLLCRPKVRFAEKFLGYYLNAACYHDQMLPYIVGTKVSSVSKASIAQTKLVVPKYEEQQAISSILADMDDEITELEQKLAKYRQVKQGMMQQLLTGKIRLV